MTVTHRLGKVDTAHARLAYFDSQPFAPEGETLVMVHGNSLRKEMFLSQFEEFGHQLRLIAFDLPGHGDSSNAADPEKTYSVVGYADALTEALGAIGVDRAIVFGHSLGGHIALELIGRVAGLKGLVLSGTPPFEKSPEGMAAAFGRDERAALSFKANMSDAEIAEFARLATDDAHPQEFWRASVRRTDPRARELVLGGLWDEKARDQLQLATGTTLPIAMINGAADAFINHDHVAGLPLRNLWDGRAHFVDGAGHASSLYAPETFNALLGRFLTDTLEQTA